MPGGIRACCGRRSSLTGRLDDAADLTQQAFCQATEAWDRFDGASQPTTRLHQILVNCARDWARRLSVRRSGQFDVWELVAAETSGREQPDIEGREELAKAGVKMVDCYAQMSQSP